jgi:glycosyltransferase involved in cell wall biosynthesis
MSKKVFFIAPSAYTLGGIQTWLDYIVPGLASHDWQATLVLTRGKHHDAHKYLEVHPTENSEFLENPTGTVQGRVNAIEELILARKPDLIVVLNIVDVYQAVSNLRQRNIQTPRLVASMHGIHPGLIGDFKNYKPAIDAVISTNRLAQRLVTEKAGMDPTRSLYAPYGVKINEATIPSQNSRPEFTIAYVGRIEEDQKRFSDVLKIFTEVLNHQANVKILVAGDGEEMPAFRAWLESQINSERVHYLGVLNEHELNKQVYQQSDVVLLTSHWETGPIVAWEAINQGALVISSKYIGREEEGSLIDGQNCLLFEIGDINSAVNQIELSRNPQLRQQLTENATSMLKDKYTKEKSIATWADCFDLICSRPILPSGDVKQQCSDQGKLSSLFGQQLAESIRKLIGIKFSHATAGSEWPHSYSGCPSESAYLAGYVESS